MSWPRRGARDGQFSGLTALWFTTDPASGASPERAAADVDMPAVKFMLLDGKDDGVSHPSVQ